MHAASFVTPYAKLLASWFPDIRHRPLLGRDAVIGTASVQSVLGGAGGQARTFLFVKARGGKVVSGRYLAPAWPTGSAEQAVDDTSGTTFALSWTGQTRVAVYVHMKLYISRERRSVCRYRPVRKLRVIL
jgi:hypothetical protein